mmetsp:Transcript_53944/g.155764  ORF Transcript_53944/g.155764 Transcript_53944/m.155764 type:complete len:106 (+) Transcript_53944:392-709(+)
MSILPRVPRLKHLKPFANRYPVAFVNILSNEMILYGFVGPVKLMKHAFCVIAASSNQITRDMTLPFTMLKREDAAIAAIPMHGILLDFALTTAPPPLGLELCLAM